MLRSNQLSYVANGAHCPRLAYRCQPQIIDKFTFYQAVRLWRLSRLQAAAWTTKPPPLAEIPGKHDQLAMLADELVKRRVATRLVASGCPLPIFLCLLVILHPLLLGRSARLAHVLHAGIAVKLASIITVRQPSRALPGKVAWRAKVDFFDDGVGHSRFGQCVMFDEGGLETLGCTAIGNAPRAKPVSQLLPGIDRGRVDITPRQPAATANRIAGLYSASNQRVLVIGKVRQHDIHVNSCFTIKRHGGRSHSPRMIGLLQSDERYPVQLITGSQASR